MNDPTAQAALDRAIDEDDRLLLVYQPIHHARTRAIWSVEALLRQRRESGEIREASIITEAAEESGGPELFVLDSMLLRRAFTDAARWRDVRLNINLSPRELEEGNVVERLATLMVTCGIDAKRVNVEITETHELIDSEKTIAMLRALKEIGVQLWLDDFGTGHSSLSHLQQFPVDGIKLPGAFVRPLPDDQRCVAITRALLQLARDLGLGVIAEEVENEAQLELLLAHGCELVQGFLYSRPMTAGRFAAVLSAEC